MTDTNAKQPTIPWVRIGVEGAVIVGSILLAFWIDAGWEQRQDRAQAHSLLGALLDDFESAAVQLDTMEAQHGRLVQNGQRLIEYGEMGGVPVEEQEQVDFLLGSHFLRPIFEPPMGNRTFLSMLLLLLGKLCVNTHSSSSNVSLAAV